jgi:hypothetical protein
MIKLKHRVQQALDESRMLVLGCQVIVGVLFRSTFDRGFERLAGASRALLLVALFGMMGSLGVLLAPVAHHRIVERGEDTLALREFIVRAIGLALLPIAFSLGVILFVATGLLTRAAVAAVAGVCAFVFAFVLWYGLEWWRGREQAMAEDEAPVETKLKDKVQHVLTEARVVLPGAQALFGFQFSIMLLDDFDRLAGRLRWLHLVSLALVAVSIVFLMAPAAYHRIVTAGDDTPSFHAFASRMVVCAMVPLGLGLTLDFFIVASKVTRSLGWAAALAGALLLFYLGLWFGYTLYGRHVMRFRSAHG